MNLQRIILPLILTILASCTVQKRIHQDGFYVAWKHKKVITHGAAAAMPVARNEKLTLEPALPTQPADILASASSDPAVPGRISPSAVPSYTDTECDLIVMRNGEEVKAKVFEVTSTTIKYKRCDLADGPLYTVNKSEVFMIKYPNGAKELMPAPAAGQSDNYSTAKSVPNKDKKLEPLALLSFLSALASLFIPVEALFLAILLAVAAVVMSVIAINKINANRDRLKGKGFAITGLVVGILVGLLLILLLSLL